MSAKVVLVTGITGQDGAYLTAKLLEEGCIVHGMRRRSSSFNTGRIDYLLEDPAYRDRLILHYGDVVDSLSLTRLIGEIGPDEIYNLAAQSHVAVSFHTPEYTANADACGALRILESICVLGLKKTKFYQASTSELFGRVHEVPQSETTPFRPRSPYATAKLYAYWITVNYREAYGLFASNGILFNHESPIRGETFVTRKITRAVAAIAEGGSEQLWLGNLDARRDWGHARDFVDGIYRIMQHDKPDDFVLATGQTNSVRRFVEVAFAEIGREIVWEGKGLDEKGRCKASGALLVEVDAKYLRPLEVDLLVGDPSKAERLLGWKSQTNFEDLVAEMVQRDVDTIRRKRAGSSLSSSK